MRADVVSAYSTPPAYPPPPTPGSVKSILALQKKTDIRFILSFTPKRGKMVPRHVQDVKFKPEEIKAKGNSEAAE